MKILIYILIFIALSFDSYSQTKLIVSLTGKILNEVTKEPLSITVEVLDESGKRVNRVKSNAKDGYYYVTGLEPGKSYFLKNVPDFESKVKLFNHKIPFNLPQTKKYEEFSKDFLFKPIAQGLALPLRVSPFSVNKSKLRPGTESYLKSYIDILKDNPKVKFEISCFPDNNNNPTANNQLTRQRADALIGYITKRGIDAGRLIVKENSATDPNSPPKAGKAAKGKKYKGSIYFIVEEM